MSFGSTALAMLGAADKAIIVVEQETSRASSSSSSGLSSISSSLTSATDSTTSTSRKVLEVEYNPTSLSIVANAENTTIKSMQQGADSNALVQGLRKPSLVLTVQLVFDAVNNQDCFYSDYLMLSASSIIGGISSVATEHTVRPQIEGFMSLMLNNNNRMVSFMWENMVFSGQVNQVTSNYTMFNRSGVPVRGNVQFQILHFIGGEIVTDYWTTAFEKIGSGQFTNSAASNLSGLTNLSI